MNKCEIISLLEHYKLGSGILKSEVKLQGMCQNAMLKQTSLFLEMFL